MLLAAILDFQKRRNGIKILMYCRIKICARPKWAANNKKHKIIGNIFKDIFILKKFLKRVISRLSIDYGF